VLAPKDWATRWSFARCTRPGDVRMAVPVQSRENERPIRETEATRVYQRVVQTGLVEPQHLVSVLPGC
jgi:hypothetical protein